MVEQIIKQPSLIPTEVSARVSHEGLVVGSTASDIFLGILKSNPDIDGVTITKYMPGDSSYEFNQGSHFPLLRYSKLEKGVLRLLDKWQPPLSDPPPADDYLRELGLFWAMGVSSKVVLKDGSTAHIPMMDHQCEVNDANEQAIVDNMKGSYPGYLLKSGKSYHYWGLNLLNHQAWLQFLSHCNQAVDDLKETSLDDNYLRESKLNGFTVLRLFAYPPDLPTEPSVIRIIH
jgi:hypothetical protein